MMQDTLKKLLITALEDCKKRGELQFETLPEVQLDAPKQIEFGDLSTNIAMLLSKNAGIPSRKIAELIVLKIKAPSDILLSASVAGPGFINFKFNPLFALQTLHEVYKKQEKYGRSKFGAGQKVMVEFVSANPTGPLHVGHGRGAVYGSALSSVLEAVGFKVTREYYLNDAGVQMQTLGKSVLLRMKELSGEKIEFPENCYQGEYIKDIAKEIASACGIAMTQKDENEAIAFCGQYAGKKIHEEILADLKELGVKHDTFFYESTLHKKKEVEKTVKFLMERGEAYEADGAVWFRSTKYGDEKDRVLKKSDGQFTYFAADIAYHKDKFDRGFGRVIDVWGADHAGHVPRMKMAITAIGHKPQDFDAVLIQLVNLIRKGELVSMSTRSAQYETLRALLDEVGKDVSRFFFLLRSHNAQLDFDMELAKKETPENPVYYVQYAHARIAGVFAKALSLGMRFKFPKGADLSLLDLPEEAALARKLAEFPDVVLTSANELEPHRITFYLMELTKEFQSYYTKGKKEEEYRFLTDNRERTAAKCYLLKNIQIVLKNGLALLGIDAPERMEKEEE